jgi:hypothetical protein
MTSKLTDTCRGWGIETRPNSRKFIVARPHAANASNNGYQGNNDIQLCVSTKHDCIAIMAKSLNDFISWTLLFPIPLVDRQ